MSFTTNYTEGFNTTSTPPTLKPTEKLEEKHVINDKSVIYNGGKEKETIETICRTIRIPINVKSRDKLPKKYPTADIDIDLTPGFYVANAIVNGRQHKTYIHCNQNKHPECYISDIPSNTSIKNFELNQLNYVGGLEDDQIEIIKNQKDTQLIDFINSIKKTNNLQTYVQNNFSDPQIVSKLAELLNQQINQGDVNQRYIDDLKRHKNTNEYLYYVIYRMILMNANIINDDVDTIELKRIVNKGLIKQNFDEISKRIYDPQYRKLISIIKNTQL